MERYGLDALEREDGAIWTGRTRERRWSDMDWTHSREKMERYGLDALEREDGAIWTGRGKRKYTSLITFANNMSYFCFVFHHTASSFSVKLFLKYFKTDKV